ncbi:Basal-body rod modification protein FlgD [Alphaproteobacteria bacterium SO-S41]|nr:Basal-body rod modification protein FlgD [Alphaproteobacteria bacterium SO-S41]
MDVSSATSAATQAGSASKTLSGNFDTFLKLLTAQLQNQDPLEPMDTSQFTQQLVQYSSVEQNIYTNKNLETLIGLQQNAGLGSAVSYIGREVSADSPDAALSNGIAEWTYTLPRPAASVSLTVTDASGKTVFSGTGPLKAGANTVGWDGKTNAGATAPDGVYTLTVKAVDSAGESMTAPLSLSGVVAGVETVDGQVVLDVGGVKLKLSDVNAVRQPVAAPSA